MMKNRHKSMVKNDYKDKKMKKRIIINELYIRYKAFRDKIRSLGINRF